MSSGPLDQLEQTLERSIENVRQVSNKLYKMYTLFAI